MNEHKFKASAISKYSLQYFSLTSYPIVLPSGADYKTWQTA